MSVLTKLLRESYDLQESKGDESAYWHLQKLREAIKSEQIKVETLPVDIDVVSTVYDCDECFKYPCVLQEWSSDKNKKLRLGDCGEKVKRNLPPLY
jgi:hypothetical protein